MRVMATALMTFITATACGGDVNERAAGGGGADSAGDAGGAGGVAAAAGVSGAGGATVDADAGSETDPTPATVRVSYSELGRATVDGDCPPHTGGGFCEVDVAVGATVTITAAPHPGMAFSRWEVESGEPPACDTPTCELTVEGPLRLRAVFTTVLNLAFATLEQVSADAIGGLTGADARCQDEADRRGFPGRYRAWLSTTEADAIDRLAGEVGWVRPDGAVVAMNAEALARGEILAPLLGGSENSWTATGSDGRLSTDGEYAPFMEAPRPVGTCGDWTDGAGAVVVGDNGLVGSGFTDATLRPCDGGGSLLCFGIGGAVPPEIVAAYGRRAFVSSASFAPATGIDTADALCAAEASAAGLDGEFLALLGTKSASAASRFDLAGPTWVRLDGVPWLAAAETLAEPADNYLSEGYLTGLNVLADGSYVTEFVDDGERDYVATGGPPELAPPTWITCNDWSDPGGDVQVGVAQAAFVRAVAATGRPCTITARVYCLER